ncbi:MAG: choice-of-anchor V domain-containing protein [Haliscomenobacter sp.]|uniref:choice-of-anchor V domain-containing protein n=1 Tax=Haliscomenobacter sp. TaxID=2717303 RepID=UPI0029ACD476|nr:choice-of-anchor V domain-containing protein [Haliscomenobacter sp.]MDX2067333.1 choice-of-anchor V domain-containing protein [Haliscomenobacter sp.]
MKKSVLVLCTLLSAIWIALSSNASGAAQNQGTDRTGSPIGDSYCGDCHGTGTYNPTVEIAMLDGANPVTTYVPGKKYTMQVSIVAGAGTPGGYGYQATVLNAKSNAQAGAFSAAPAGQRIVTLGGRQYAEQSRRSTSNTFQMPWTAPAAGTGDLKVYAAGMAVNGDGGTGRDNAVKATLSLIEATSTGLTSNRILSAQIKVFPNPAVELARVEIEGSLENEQLWVNLLDVQGRIRQSKKLQQPAQTAQVDLNVKALPKGQYWVQVSDGQRTKTISLLK